MLLRHSLHVLVAAFTLEGVVLHAQQLPLGVPIQDKPPSLSLPSPQPAKVKPNTPTLPSATVQKPIPPGFLPNKPSSLRGQFVIHGADLATRTDIGQQCDAISDDLRRLLRDPLEWSAPIVISIKTPPNISLSEPAVRANFAQLSEGGFHLQMNVQMRPDYNDNDLRAELIRMLIAERILRDHKEITTTRTRILPDWLLVGVTEALRFRERSRPSALFAAVFKTGKVYGIEEILGVSPGTLDALSRTIYETSCCALVLALIEQPEGGLRMGKFLNALATDNRTDRELINQWFPGVAQSKSSLDKWWAIQMANLSRPTVFENLDPGETAKALDQALMLHFEVEAGNEPVASAAKTKSEAVDEEPVEESKQRGFFSRLFSSTTDADQDKPKDEKKPEKKAEPEPKPLTDEELAKSKQQGFHLRNLFGGSNEDKPAKKEEKKTEPKKEAPTPEPKKEAPAKPKEKPVEKPKDEEAKRPGLFSRLFSSEDKDKAQADKKGEPNKEAPKPEPKKEESKKPEDKKNSAYVTPELSRLIADLTVPSIITLFDLTQSLSVSESHFTILGFGKKKPDEESVKDKAENKKPTPKSDKKEEKPDSKKKTEKKTEPKEETAPEPKPKPAKKKMVMTSLPLEDYPRVQKRGDAKQVFNRTANELASLTQRAHPLFRGIIADYVQLVSDLAGGKTKDIDARLKELKARRAQALTLAKAVQDHLDWFEASQSTKWSGTFDDFLRVPQMIDEEFPKRTDPISKYLDEVEKEQGK